MKTLDDLFKHQIKDLFSAETQLISALPFIADNVNNKKLTKVFEDQLIESKKQKSRLETICREINVSPSGKNSYAVKEIIKDIKKLTKKAANHEVLDVGIIAKVQRIEHYEIAGYGTAIRFAKELGHTEIADKLQETLREVYDVDNILNEIAEDRINRKAIENLT
ncbi:YciE/YciF ferroxidase family protein [Algibacter pacificus]|uniref:YciE/YciF ferroxidase family protein n=1 Tax=Algibacter pacificus TaxID=2599389 RepID=UPI0011C80B86|nr:DUF892 family protein [Algibacter pacificus]